MIATIETAALVGVDASSIQVETELAQGLPYFSIIGLGDTAVKEARYRIQAALRASGFELPHRRVTINLAPASLRKDGAALDLPMALALLVAAGRLGTEQLRGTLAFGELALSGELRPVRGVLSVAALALSRELRRVIVPFANGPEAAAIDGLEVLAPKSLLALLEHLDGKAPLAPADPVRRADRTSTIDLDEVRGQQLARRALEIAAAGAHNLLLVGNPGGGKTMLARRLPSILPQLTAEERIEVTKVWSAAGKTLAGGGLVTEPPFRAPHHSISEAGLVGGGYPIRPGEVSLAHRGVLFLDEMPEIPRRVLEALRQPLEDREVTLSRARQSVRLPAAFMLVGAANPCPCGWLGHHSGRCWCRADEIQKYAGRLSGPLLDRIDLIVEAPSLSAKDIFAAARGESSSHIRRRVERARTEACARRGTANAQLDGKRLAHHARASPEARALLAESVDRLQLSARSLERTLRVARTIADLDRSTDVIGDHVAEALRYRRPSNWSVARF